MEISCPRIKLVKWVTLFFCLLLAMPVHAGGIWSTLAPMSGARFGLAAGSINGKIYAVGGVPISSCSATSRLESYDPATDTWETKAPMPTARYGVYAGVVNGILYSIGGSNFCNDYNVFATVEAYDPVINTWVTKAPMPTARHDMVVGVVGDIIYAVGGQKNYQILATMEAYDPATNTWTTKAPLPKPLVVFAVGVVDDILYVVGGYDAEGKGNGDVYAYDSVTDIWTTVAPMSQPRIYLSAAVVNGKLYAIGGIANGVGVATVESYDPTSDIWATETSMLAPRVAPATAVANGVLYAIGGWNGAQAFAKNEAFTPALPPTASAGANQTVHVGLSVSLDGSGSSDPGGSPLAYQWSLESKPAGSGASLSNPTIVNPTFSPDVPGNYIVRLTVTNSSGSVSSPATVTISTTNSPPVADAGTDSLVTIVGTNVQLGGNQSYDQDGDAINYYWTLTASPAGSSASLIGANTATPTLYPDVYGTYVAELVVSDPWTFSQPSTVTISFEELKPVANAQQSQSIPVGTIAFLDGTNSSDANRDPLTYKWTFVSLPANSQSDISSPTASLASFIPDLPGTYIAQLIVNDGIMNSDPSTVQFQVFSTESAVIAAATDIQASVSSIPAIALKNANMKKTFLNKLNAAIASIDAGLYADALDQLKNDILGKTDGCATTGTPDKNDWIITCPVQNQVYPLIQETIWIVEGLLPQ